MISENVIKSYFIICILITLFRVDIRATVKTNGKTKSIRTARNDDLLSLSISVFLYITSLLNSGPELPEGLYCDDIN